MSELMKVQNMAETNAGFKPTRHEVAEFLGSQVLCSIASLGLNGQPQIARVAFSQTAALDIIIGTDELSRKAVNVLHDNRVAVEVTDAERRYTVQAEGTARKLQASEFDTFAPAHFEKLPSSAPFRDVQGQCYFMINPSWLRFSDCNPHPWVLTEFNFDTI